MRLEIDPLTLKRCDKFYILKSRTIHIAYLSHAMKFGKCDGIVIMKEVDCKLPSLETICESKKEMK